jgi:hypothetical protein
MPVLNVTSFWLFAIATSAFSALNEREYVPALAR